MPSLQRTSLASFDLCKYMRKRLRVTIWQNLDSPTQAVCAFLMPCRFKTGLTTLLRTEMVSYSSLCSQSLVLCFAVGT